MIRTAIIVVATLLLAACGPAHQPDVDDARRSANASESALALLAFSAPRLRADENIDFAAAYAGHTLLAVNTASRCGFAGQFEQLEALYQKYREQGLRIVGFPSNDFRQEHADADAIAEVCYVNYGVTFDMVAESSVRGPASNAFFQRLAERSGQAPVWNFNKYLISADGGVQHFAAESAPLGGALEQAVVETLSSGG